MTTTFCMGTAHRLRSPSAVFHDANERYRKHPATASMTQNQQAREIMRTQPTLSYFEALRVARDHDERT